MTKPEQIEILKSKGWTEHSAGCGCLYHPKAGWSGCTVDQAWEFQQTWCESPETELRESQNTRNVVTDLLKQIPL